jgi:DNA-binding NarL/FixJ family response regulator
MFFRPIKLALVDDHTLFRKTLAGFLSSQKNIEIVLEAADASEFFEKIRPSLVDILLLDIFMPKMNGTEIFKRLREEFPEIRTVVLSMTSDLDLVADLIEAGIYGFVNKADEPSELLTAISEVSEERIYRNRMLTEALYHSKQNLFRAYTDLPFSSISDREKKVLQLIWEEKSNKTIANELFLGVRSVEKIRQDIKVKLGVKSTVGLMKYAISTRIIRNIPISH